MTSTAEYAPTCFGKDPGADLRRVYGKIGQTPCGRHGTCASSEDAGPTISASGALLCPTRRGASGMEAGRDGRSPGFHQHMLAAASSACGTASGTPRSTSSIVPVAVVGLGEKSSAGSTFCGRVCGVRGIADSRQAGRTARTHARVE